MVEVLHVYKEVDIVNQELVSGALKEPPVVTISYDEKPGIQAIGVTTPDRPPAPHQHPSHLRPRLYRLRLRHVSPPKKRAQEQLKHPICVAKATSRAV